MSRKTTELISLQARKQLLIVESELNRAQVLAEWTELRKGLEPLVDRVATVGSFVESAARIGTSFSSLFQEFPRANKNGDGRKPSWVSRIVSGARVGIYLWSALRSHRR